MTALLEISRLSTKDTEILEGAKIPIIYFTGAGAPFPSFLSHPCV